MSGSTAEGVGMSWTHVAPRYRPQISIDGTLPRRQMTISWVSQTSLSTPPRSLTSTMLTVSANSRPPKNQQPESRGPCQQRRGIGNCPATLLVRCAGRLDAAALRIATAQRFGMLTHYLQRGGQAVDRRSVQAPRMIRDVLATKCTLNRQGPGKHLHDGKAGEVRFGEIRWRCPFGERNVGICP